MDTTCFPVALASVLHTLSTSCHLTSWDVHGKGKQTTLILRWNNDSTAITAPGQHEAQTFARYRKKSPCEVRRDVQRAESHRQSAGQSIFQSANNNDTPNSQNDMQAQPSLVENPLPSHHTTECKEDETTHSATVSVSVNHEDQKGRYTLSEGIEPGSDRTEQQYSDSVSSYMSTLSPEERDITLKCAKDPVVNKVVLDHCYRKHCMYAKTGGIVFKYSLKERSIVDWFSFTPKEEEKRSNRTLDSINRWPAVDPIRFGTEINSMTRHIHACCSVILRESRSVYSDP